jgi:coenzyme F420-reducing hydrogenase beta subunit
MRWNDGMKLCEEYKCYGCDACINICPVNAIQMTKEQNGFLYPELDEKQCIDCGLCGAACPGNETNFSDIIRKDNVVEYACIHKDKRIVHTSQSGGAFYGLAETILEQGGIVYGAAFDEGNYVVHLKVDQHEDLWRLQGSKYVQSRIGDTFKEIGKLLQDGRTVLFSGTSCQAAGLILYLKNKKIKAANLYTCDLLCHGIPSHIVFKDYIRFLEEKYGAKIKKPNLRDKNIINWKTHVESYCDSHGNIHTESLWTELFYSDLLLRRSCGDCIFGKENWISDITVGDLWKGEEYINNFNEYQDGISVALVHTEKGNDLIKSGKFSLQTIEHYSQRYSAKLSYQAPRFWKVYYSKGFETALKKFTSYGGLVTKSKRKILRRLKMW